MNTFSGVSAYLRIPLGTQISVPTLTWVFKIGVPNLDLNAQL